MERGALRHPDQQRVELAPFHQLAGCEEVVCSHRDLPVGRGVGHIGRPCSQQNLRGNNGISTLVVGGWWWVVGGWWWVVGGWWLVVGVLVVGVLVVMLVLVLVLVVRERTLIRGAKGLCNQPKSSASSPFERFTHEGSSERGHRPCPMSKIQGRVWGHVGGCEGG